MPALRRYSQQALPRYRHRIGRTPHPLRDPQGHSHGQAEPCFPDLRVEDWRRCEPFLHGLDLFNHGYWWESHELFEGLWGAAGRRTTVGNSLQILILCAVAHLHADAVRSRAAQHVLAKAEAHIGLPHADLGIDLPGLLARTRAFVEDQKQSPAQLQAQY